MSLSMKVVRSLLGYVCLVLIGASPSACNGQASPVSGSGGAAGSGGCGSGGCGSGGSGSGGVSGTGGQDAGIDVAAPDAPDSSGGHDAGGAASFVVVQAIFAVHCVRCHDPAHPVVPESPTFVDTPLTPAAAYGALVGKPAHETCGGTLVTPGAPAQSYLFHKVSDETPCDGKRMPHPGMLARTTPLSATELDAISSWIRGGAQR